MSFSYYRNTWCGATAVLMHNDQEIEACALVIATLRQNRRWGGSVVGHRSKKRDRVGGDILTK
jgi:hypothetical protein